MKSNTGDFYAITYAAFAVWWDNAGGANKWASKLRIADAKQTERVKTLFNLADVRSNWHFRVHTFEAQGALHDVADGLLLFRWTTTAS